MVIRERHQFPNNCESLFSRLKVPVRFMISDVTNVMIDYSQKRTVAPGLMLWQIA
jgi:hypothetical protein